MPSTEIPEDIDGNPLPAGRKFKVTVIFYDNECLTTDKPSEIGQAFKEVVNEAGVEIFCTEVLEIEELPKDN